MCFENILDEDNTVNKSAKLDPQENFQTSVPVEAESTGM